MRRLMLSAVLAASLVAIPGVAAAGEATAPTAACNAGTMNAHSRVPETTGAGVGIEAHEHIPEAEGDECVHEAFA